MEADSEEKKITRTSLEDTKEKGEIDMDDTKAEKPLAFKNLIDRYFTKFYKKLNPASLGLFLKNKSKRNLHSLDSTVLHLLKESFKIQHI
jgi:hypothetical protein